MTGIVLVDGLTSVRDAAAPMAEIAGELTDAVFTTARVESGAIVRRALHRERLLDEGPDDGTAERALDEADDLASQIGEGMVRVAVGRKLDRYGRVVAAGPARRRVWRPGDARLRLGLAIDPRPVPVTKRVDRAALTRIDALARRLGMDGAVLIGPEGVREGTWFHVAHRSGGGRWITPPRSALVSFGTTRAAFVEREECDERPVTLDELLAAEEVRVLSALVEVAEARLARDLIVPRGIELSIE